MFVLAPSSPSLDAELSEYTICIDFSHIPHASPTTHWQPREERGGGGG